MEKEVEDKMKQPVIPTTDMPSPEDVADLLHHSLRTCGPIQNSDIDAGAGADRIPDEGKLQAGGRQEEHQTDVNGND